MKVLQVINQLEPGGAEILVRDLSIEMSDKGVDISIYLLKSTNSDLEKDLKDKEIRCYFGVKGSPRSMRQVIALASHLKKHNYDVVHSHLFPSQLWLPLACKIARVSPRLICTEHNTYYRRREKWYYKLLDKYLFKRYDFVVGVSQKASESLENYMPFLNRKIHTILNGVPLAKFKNANSNTNSKFFNNDFPIVVSVGRLHPQKNFPVLIEAMSQLSKINLIIVGDGKERTRLQDLIEKKGLTERILLLGKRNDIPSLLKSSDIFVLPSNWEGFGIVILEAMAVKIPVIVTAIPGVTEWVGKGAYLVKPNSPSDIAKGITELLNKPIIRQQMIDVSQNIIEDYSIDKVADRHLNLYQQHLKHNTN